MLAIKFDHILNARGITNHHKFLIDSGFTSHTASNLLHSETKSFKLEHIERLCRVLICEPNDIVTYYPSKKYPLQNNHPLNNLIKDDQHSKSMPKILKTLSYKELMKIVAAIQETTTPKTQKPDTSAELS